jgi:hypothetical protein
VLLFRQHILIVTFEVLIPTEVKVPLMLHYDYVWQLLTPGVPIRNYMSALLRGDRATTEFKDIRVCVSVYMYIFHNSVLLP